MLETLKLASAFISQLIDVAKSAFIFLFIRKSSETKINYEYLKKQNKRQKKQLEISAQPRRSWSGLLERMRADKL